MNILGISAYYHDSAAALICSGEVIAAAQEERFTRIKHDACFPRKAILYCLSEARLSMSDIDHIVFYDKPLLKFERLLETYFSFAPRGLLSFLMSMPIWLKEKLYLKSQLKLELSKLAGCKKNEINNLLFTEHHQSHAAAAFFPSPFDDAVILCMDGVGEWATTSAWSGRGNKLEPLWEINFPHSLGLLYSAFTYYAGFKVNSGEYKLMGLAPYGEPVYADMIKEHLVDIKSDGTFRLNMKYFGYATGLSMTNKSFDRLFGAPPRKPESEISQREMDIAASIQLVTEEIVLKLASSLHRETGAKNLCLSGGVALNCVANGKVLRESPFENIWIQPASGDAGSALGAALSGWYEKEGRERLVPGGLKDSMKGSYLGPSYTNDEVERRLSAVGASYTRVDDAELMPMLAKIISEENVVGWSQGKMEFGPRALGGRSIIGDPRSQKMQSIMNLKIKYRESFRPFAPSVLAEKVSDWFVQDASSPYMLIVAPIQEAKRLEVSDEERGLFGVEKLKVSRSDLPAVTHVDYSARIQTVHKETNPRYHMLISAFEEETGCPVLVNTSFNVRGEPIVCTPEDAYRCFMRTEMDYLVVENYLLKKSDQPELQGDSEWRAEFELD